MKTKFTGYTLLLFPPVLHAARLDQALRISASGTDWPVTVTALVLAAEPAQTAGPQRKPER